MSFNLCKANAPGAGELFTSKTLFTHRNTPNIEHKPQHCRVLHRLLPTRHRAPSHASNTCLLLYRWCFLPL